MLTKLLFGFGVTLALSFGQQPSGIAGDYAGMLGPLHVMLHLVAGQDGSLTGTVDSRDQGMSGIPCVDIHVNGQGLSFSVPAIHGSWMGFVSADNNALSGTWNQGTAMPLNLTRVTAASAPVPSASYPSAASAAPGAPEQACPAGSMANYWDGSAWKPMTLAPEVRAERGFSLTEGLKNPLNPMAGHTTIKRYKGASASIALASTPKFCFPTTVNTAPQFIIGELVVKKDYRELEIKFSDRHSDSWVPARKSFDVDMKRTSPTSIEVTPKTPLEPGEYIVTSSYIVYDFNVRDSK
jgi:hypothetical protein